MYILFVTFLFLKKSVAWKIRLIVNPNNFKSKAKSFQKATFYGFHYHIYLPVVNRQSRFSRGVLSRQVGFPASPISLISRTWIYGCSNLSANNFDSVPFWAPCAQSRVHKEHSTILRKLSVKLEPCWCAGKLANHIYLVYG